MENHLPEAQPGDNVGFNIKGVSVKELKRGYVASDSKNDPAKGCESFQAQVCHCACVLRRVLLLEHFLLSLLCLILSRIGFIKEVDYGDFNAGYNIFSSFL